MHSFFPSRYVKYLYAFAALIIVINISVDCQDTLRIDTSGIVKVNALALDTTSSRSIFHSPIRAGLLSATLPGLGQVYNKKYWKVAVVYAAIGTSTYFFVKNQQLYKLYLQGYVDYSNTHDMETLKGIDNVYGKTEPLRRCEFYMDIYRRWRDLSIVSLAASYFLNIIDATVDGYLFDYDISDKLTLRVEPTQIPTVYTQAIGVRLTFNFH